MTNSVDFGCGYCADDQNRWYGHVTQVGSNAQTRLVLLRCPRCGSMYSNAPRGRDQTRRLTVEEARQAFPDWVTTRDIAER